VIPEGFTADQESDFDTIVADAVSDLMKWDAARPFDLMLNRGSINVWSIFMPSRQRGACALYESRIFVADGKTQAQGIGATYNPPATGTLHPSQVDGFAGLPVRSDAILETDSIATKKQKWEAKLDEWNAIFGPVDAARVPLHIYEAWTASHSRTLLDEQDTAFGIAFGARPEIENYIDENIVTTHPWRTQREHVDAWLSRITDGDGPVIGRVWAGNAKDNRYIIAILGGARAGGAEGGIAAASLGTNTLLDVTRIGNGPRHTIQPFDFTRTVWGAPEMTRETRGTIVHELAHAFGLQDEYADRTDRANGPTSRTAGNVQPLEELLDPAVPAASRVGDGLVGDRLRWRGPRILRAGVLAGAIVKTAADEFRIPLRKDHKLLFKVGDRVFLRQRPLRGTVVETTGTTRKTKLQIAKISVPLRVLADSDASERIVVTADGATFDPAEFPGANPPFESIVFVPVPAPPDAAAANEPWADLVPRVVRKHITKTGLPMNRTAGIKCSDLGAGAPYSDPRQEAKNVPTNVTFSWSHQWVGAFDGGGRFSCGIFHPSPICAMNHALQWFTNDKVGTFVRIAPFCPVCSYLLVDAIDPNLHGDIDAFYAPDYVEARP
jgi:hypothetical protein